MWKKIVLALLIIASGTAGYFVAKAQVTLDTTVDVVNTDYDTALEQVDLSGINVNSDDDIINILLIGNDYRKETNYGAGGITDTMMIATLDMKHKKLKLTSLMRDMLVDIPGYSPNKLNAAYSFGGVELLYKTIAQNFNIQLDGYVEVSFEAFEKVVDDVGGVKVELTQSEADYLNSTNYISKKKYRNVKVGKQTLNGNQALGFCRIRKTVFTVSGKTDDYGRTERQRVVIDAIFDKAKTMSFAKWLKIAKDVLGKYVTTDLSSKKIKGYMKDTVFMGTTKINQLQIPVNGYYSGIRDARVGSCLQIDATAQSEALNQFIFKWNGKGEFTYTPSSGATSTTTTY